ncbi:MAG: hypothetical protein E7568_05475 [Ruminococcaceae bacterium]|nr:hypothetical protein [Oscillospiraceae bacterium]
MKLYWEIMMKFIDRLLYILLTLVLISFMLCGCKKINNKAVIYYEATTLPVTLDPQIASNDTEMVMIRNLFEGLMRVNKDGEIVCGVATDYTYKNMTYTFNISDTALWSDGTSVTADDFVFAFRRAVDPVTKSPYASKLGSILNAELIMSGSISLENLGVKAVDSKTLQIIMEKDDINFLYKLTTSVCMPCKEEFFNDCQGQYGVTKAHILTNGSYKLTKWNKEDFAVRMHKNDKYYGAFSASNSAIFMSSSPETDNLEKLSKSSIDIGQIKMTQLDESATHRLNNAQEQNIVWVMELSGTLPKELRQALFLSFNRSIYSGDLAPGFSTAYSLFPETVTMQNLDYVGMPAYNINTAKQLFIKSLNSFPDKKLPTTTLIYYGHESMQLPISNIVGHWQNNLGAYINIQPTTSMAEIENGLKNGTNAIAIYPITVTDKDPGVLCHLLGYDYAGASDKNLTTVQTNIMSQYTIMPIAFENSVICYSSDIIDFNFSLGNGMIDFAYVTKK